MQLASGAMNATNFSNQISTPLSMDSQFAHVVNKMPQGDPAKLAVFQSLDVMHTIAAFTGTLNALHAIHVEEFFAERISLFTITDITAQNTVSCILRAALTAKLNYYLVLTVLDGIINIIIKDVSFAEFAA